MWLLCVQVTVIYAVTMLLVEIGVAGLIGFITLIVSTPCSSTSSSLGT